MFFMGFEDVTYEEDKDGNFKYLDTITDNPNGLNMDQAISEYLTWPGGYYPGMVRQKFFQGAEGKENSAVNAEKVRPYRIKDDNILPGLNYTLDETDKVSAIMTDVQTYIDEMTAGFITGKQDFSKWDDYKETLEKMGIQEYLEVSQGAYDRSKEAK
jgi:putative aldouronate transport system substrate-binding protein